MALPALQTPPQTIPLEVVFLPVGSLMMAEADHKISRRLPMTFNLLRRQPGVNKPLEGAALLAQGQADDIVVLPTFEPHDTLESLFISTVHA